MPGPTLTDEIANRQAIDDALAAAQGSNAVRDTPKISEPEHRESAGVGRSLEAENLAARRDTLTTRLAAAIKADNAAMVAKIQAQLEEL